MSECARLADQIRRAFDGEAWHGDALVEVLANVSAKQAAARPIKSAHNIWEIVLHIGAWDGAVLRRAGGTAVTLTDAATKDEAPPALRREAANADEVATTGELVVTARMVGVQTQRPVDKEA